MPDFSAFFIGRQKINYNYLVIFFFPSADSFGVLAIGRWSADGRPTIGRWSADKLADVIFEWAKYHRPMCRPTVGRSSADDRPIVAHHLSSADVSADDRPIVKFWVWFRKSASFVFNVIAPIDRQNDVYRPIKIQKFYRPTVFLNVISA